MSFVTPSLLHLKTALEARYPGIKFGIYNRRPIAGSSTWSQHSWPNALDIFFTSYGDTSAAHQQMLDKVAWFIRDNHQTYKVRYLLWRRPSHYDHIHVDFWPMGYGVPSTSRGGEDNIYKTADHRIINQTQLQEGEDELAILSDAQQEELAKFLDVIDAEGSSVYFAREAIRLIRKERELVLHKDEPFNLDDYEIIIQRKEV